MVERCRSQVVVDYVRERVKGDRCDGRCGRSPSGSQRLEEEVDEDMCCER